MATLRDFIENRRAEIAEELKPLDAQRMALDVQISALRSELRDLESAGAAIGMVNGLQRESESVDKSRKPTIKEAVLLILKDRQGGLVALDILREINDRFDLGIERTSLSPQLSRLKNDGAIDRRGIVWFFVDKDRTSEADKNTPRSAEMGMDRAIRAGKIASGLLGSASSIVGSNFAGTHAGQVASDPMFRALQAKVSPSKS